MKKRVKIYNSLHLCTSYTNKTEKILNLTKLKRTEIKIKQWLKNIQKECFKKCNLTKEYIQNTILIW